MALNTFIKIWDFYVLKNGTQITKDYYFPNMYIKSILSEQNQECFLASTLSLQQQRYSYLTYIKHCLLQTFC